MGAQPGRPHHPIGCRDIGILGRRIAPKVGVVVRHPASGMIHLPGRLLPVGIHTPHMFKQRQMTLAQSTTLCRPVIHLGIDVDGIFAVPGGLDLIAPDAL